MREARPVDMLTRLATAVDGLRAERSRVLVAIDGPDAAGKTILADRLASRLSDAVVRASIDDFQQPQAVRLRCGELSAEGYYCDGFDHEALACRLLNPFTEDAATVTRAWFDCDLDQQASESIEVPERRYAERYLPAQALYRADVDPEATADIVIDNTDPASPEVLRWNQARLG